MAILLVATDRDLQPLKAELLSLTSNATQVWVYPEIPDPSAVEVAVLWKHPEGLARELPHLKLASSLGAGVEHLLNDPYLNPSVRLTRIVDPALTISMRNYVVMAILNIQKQLIEMISNQRQKLWQKPNPVELPLRIGVLGLGALGGDIARFLAQMDFEVWGYSSQRRDIPGVICRSTMQEDLTAFVARTNVLVCLLPLTKTTRGILNLQLFRCMPKNSYIVNVARGGHLIEPDLVEAMKEGYIAGAFLDVFEEEPLPVNHPFWQQSGIVITPHCASITHQENAARIIFENYTRLKSGKDLLLEVDRTKGY